MSFLDRFRRVGSAARAAEAGEGETARPAVPRTPVKVGWFFKDVAGSVVMDDPEMLMPEPDRVRSVEASKRHAKSASRCPAVINIESRYFVIRCPYDLHLRFERDPKGQAVLRNMAGEASPIRQKFIAKTVTLVAEPEWRYPNRPTMQIITPYVFVADEPVYLSQLPPFFSYLQHPWPGTLFGGRFPIHVWPRQLIWAFEWHDIKKDLVLKRGDPWFYVHFETMPQDRPVHLFETERTPELIEFVDSVAGAVNYVNQTFSLFKVAERRRPATLLKPRQR